ncbi:MAG: mycothiol system anti-sigma-R factor [Gemmatimonadetes bacterium]|nr:mycothiol system anti-sigma-R factor [Gemmatimonadota bacterium]
MSTMEMLSCHQVMAQLWAYIDGELTPELNEQVRAHLEMCARCYPQYDFERAFLAFLQRMASEPVPAGLRRKVFEQLLAEDTREEAG